MDQIRLLSEERYRDELAALMDEDKFHKPKGWKLSPRAVETFIMGADKPIAITPKYIGDRYMIQVAIATLASDRALLLVGEPGTAKSWLSEHLAAAICGSSRLIIQGTAGTTEDQIKYSWNYALLLAEGPSEKALVRSPMYRAMEEGAILRFEEVTRCSSEIQDSMISLLSEKHMVVPELNSIITGRKGFNVIATANTRDRGVNEMSSALKRRFNFVTVPVLENLQQEIAVVVKRTEELKTDYEIEAQVPADMVEVLVAMFQELRRGKSQDGATKIKGPSGAMSTAEVISVMFNGAILAEHFGNKEATPKELARSMVGTIAKENTEDLRKLEEYNETILKGRKGNWEKMYRAMRDEIKRL